eukprot:767286-Hanusia_phi.AAC.1
MEGERVNPSKSRDRQSTLKASMQDVSDNEGLASTRRWFPMVSFLEENCSGNCPHLPSSTILAAAGSRGCSLRVRNSLVEACEALLPHEAQHRLIPAHPCQASKWSRERGGDGEGQRYLFDIPTGTLSTGATRMSDRTRSCKTVCTSSSSPSPPPGSENLLLLSSSSFPYPHHVYFLSAPPIQHLNHCAIFSGSQATMMKKKFLTRNCIKSPQCYPPLPPLAEKGRESASSARLRDYR